MCSSSGSYSIIILNYILVGQEIDGIQLSNLENQLNAWTSSFLVYLLLQFSYSYSLVHSICSVQLVHWSHSIRSIRANLNLDCRSIQPSVTILILVKCTWTASIWTILTCEFLHHYHTDYTTMRILSLKPSLSKCGKTANTHKILRRLETSKMNKFSMLF